MKDFDQILKLMVEKKASDLFITEGIPPSMKVDGKIMPLKMGSLTPEKSMQLVLAQMTERQRVEFSDTLECNFAILRPDIGRFRVSAFYQRGQVGMVLRRIETQIPKIGDLGLPPIIHELSMVQRGLIIFVGATGSGKSTSLASMIGERNRNSKGHIISIEDPIEYVHEHDGCIITQREVGIDTDSFEVALKNTLRQAPNVIMIGEIRSRDVMENAVTFAETGHLCLATLHANNANQALDRILHFFPSERHAQLWLDLSLNLKSIVAQQLLPRASGKGRVAVIEVLLNSPLAADLIRKGEVYKLKELMSRSNELGMQTFDQALFKAYVSGDITYDDALHHADSANDLRLMIKLKPDEQTKSAMQAQGEGLRIEGEEEENEGGERWDFS